MEEESESIQDIEDIEDIEDMEDMEEHIPNKLDRPKQDLDFSCE